MRAVRTSSPDRLNRVTYELPEHLTAWRLPPDWNWGSEGVSMEFRHSQEVVDALGRSLALVSAPDSRHTDWLAAEARHLAHRNHPSIPTTYHYWSLHPDSRRGPGYLRRWITAETIGARVRRTGPEALPNVLRVLRAVGSTLAYLHDGGTVHGGVSPETVSASPTWRIWMLGWQWAVPMSDVPTGIRPDAKWTPVPPELRQRSWQPTPMTDQWQLAASCFFALTGELPPDRDVPPVQLVRPETPRALASVLDVGLRDDPAERFPTISAMVRAMERASGSRNVMVSGPEMPAINSEEARLRWAVGDDYEVLGFLGRGTFGSVWRVRDLSLEREVALKVLHPTVAQDELAVARFRREARLAAQLAHPAIIPIFDFDTRGGVSWYTMELAEGGSVADLVAGAGPRQLDEIVGSVANVLDGLAAAHAHGIVHRDLKPENILIDRYRRWRVTDFGIARGEDEAAGATGTPAFAAPEQLLGERQTAAVDCFAMAAIVFFVLTGEPPFSGSDVRAILAQQLAGGLELPPFPEPLSAWLRRGLTADSGERYRDAAEMNAAWRDVLSALHREDRRGESWWERLLGPRSPLAVDRG
ncbi:MAG: Serine/threonine-protein kinase PknD [Gemmatimonadaceae bacterium]|nr:Serine/threonine-protein kinase PknD [Gemmatimonadaceae bacterium]